LEAQRLQFRLALGGYPLGYPGDSTHPSSMEEAEPQRRRSRRLRGGMEDRESQGDVVNRNVGGSGGKVRTTKGIT